jgi:hypothetical protein
MNTATVTKFAVIQFKSYARLTTGEWLEQSRHPDVIAARAELERLPTSLLGHELRIIERMVVTIDEVVE